MPRWIAPSVVAAGPTIDGRAVSGTLAGAALAPADHDHTFWFAWFAFHTDTGVAAAAG